MTDLIVQDSFLNCSVIVLLNVISVKCFSISCSYYFKIVPLYQTLSSVEVMCFEVYELIKRIKEIDRPVPSAERDIFYIQEKSTHAAFMVQIWGVY